LAGSRRFDRRTLFAGGIAASTTLALGGAGAVALDACGGGSRPLRRNGRPGVGSGRPRYGGSAIVGLNSETGGFLPSMSVFDNSGLVYANTVFDSLTKVAADGSIQPYLAQSVSPSPDYSSWTIALRPGVVFHDGSPLTPEVVVANIEAIKQSPLLSQAATVISSVAAVNATEVQVNLHEPVVALPYYLSTQVGYIVALSQLNDPNGSSHPVGTGPFRMVDWEPNDHFTARRNHHYWRKGLPYLDTITYKPIPEDQSRQSSLQSGTIDLMVTRDPHAIVDLRDDADFQQVTDLDTSIGQPNLDFIILNTAVEPTSDLTVRQALACATDADELNRLLGAGVTKKATSLFPPGSPYRPADNGYPTYDLAKAKELMAQASRSHGATLKLALDTLPDPRLAVAVQALQSMWSRAGFHVSVGQIEQVAFIANLAVGDFTAYTDEQFSAPDPDLNYVWLSTTTASPPGTLALNFSRNKDPELEAALQQGRTHPDPATRIQAYQTVDTRLAADLPYLWISQASWSITGNNSVMNFDNPTLPDGAPAQGFSGGVFLPTSIWKSVDQ
jgi:peptide/nickel transport system substrate-binding protein